MDILHGNMLSDFLRRRVKEGLTHNGVFASDLVEFYLVNLLIAYVFTQKLYEIGGIKDKDKALAIILMEACEDDKSPEKITRVKHVGDKALYMSGVFIEHIAKSRLVTIEYYESMGKKAYAMVAELLRGDFKSGIYRELSQKFHPLACALSTAASANSEISSKDVVKIYEMWLETKDERLLEKLKRCGIDAQQSSARK